MPVIIFLIFLLFPFRLVQAQMPACSGNLGSNIFTDGDFGSGINNIFPNNPNLAPGYNYTFTPPPNDGFYTLTSNTGLWNDIFPSWLFIEDNSPDPNGYMMVVNASYNTGIFYEKIIGDLCENTLYEFSADAINLIQPGVGGHIMPNVSFLINDVISFNTGNIPQNGAWNTYGFTFSTAPGETSVKLTLRNNAPGGIGNDLALDNISFRACGPEALILPTTISNICEDGNPIDLEATIFGSQYPNPALQWQRSLDEGITWEDIPGETDLIFTHTQLSGGFYYYRYLLANNTANLSNSKCRVISNVKVVFVVPKFYTRSDTVCEGLGVSLGSNTFFESGIYQDSFLSEIGCDSIVTLDLTVLPDPGLDALISIQAPSCTGYHDGQIEIPSVLNGSAPYTLQFADSLFSDTSALFSNLSAGEYSLRIEDRYGCSLDLVLAVYDPAPFQLELGPDLRIELGDFIQLHVAVNYPMDQFTWTPAVDFSTSDPLNPEGYPSQSGQYRLDAISSSGCLATDSISIQVEVVRRLFFPNVFSPNDDGVNDFFTLSADQPNVQSILFLEVYDRWGGLVYQERNIEVNDPSSGWDGTMAGQKLSPGIYVYQAKIIFLDGVTKIYSGDVLMVR